MVIAGEKNTTLSLKFFFFLPGFKTTHYIADSAYAYGSTRICSSSTSTPRWRTRSIITASPFTPTSPKALSGTASHPPTAPTSAPPTATTTATTTSTALAGTARDSGSRDTTARCATPRVLCGNRWIRRDSTFPTRCSGRSPWDKSFPTNSARTS